MWLRKFALMNKAEGDGAAAGASGGAAASGAAGSGGNAAGDGKGAAASGADGGSSGLLAQQAAAAAAAAAGKGGAGAGGAEGSGAPGGEGKPARPEHIPEQFWDAEKGAVRTDAAIKAWQDTRTALTELQKAKGIVAPPEKPEGYKVEPPKDLKLPPNFKLDENDQAIGIFRQVAHKAKLTQEQFNEAVFGFIQAAGPLMPPPVDVVKEKAAIGPNADAVMEAVFGWGQNLVDTGLWSKDEFAEIIEMGSTAVGIRALNKLREAMGEKAIPVDAVVGDALPSAEELYQQVADPRYQTDAAFRAKVDADFEKVFGKQAAGSSPAGLGVGASSPARGFGTYQSGKR